MKTWARQPGFTIVELLVVIVVIGILASISVVGYNGIQQRAKSAAWVNAVASWEKILHLYRADNGTWPNTGGYLVCLGDGFTAGDGYAADQCLWSNPAGIAASSSATINSGIASSVGSTPTVVLPEISTIDPTNSNREAYVRGVVYNYQAGGAAAPFIEYYLDEATAANGCLRNDSLEFDQYTGGEVRCRRYLQ